MSRHDDTICAFATATGRAGVAVLRISGPASRAVLRQLGVTRTLPPRVAQYARLKCPEQGTTLDHALVLSFVAPHSFTGEDVVELHLHGGRAVMQSVLRAVLSTAGVRVAEPGEFTRRAFINGKCDLTEAEAVIDLIHADTEAQARQALRQMDGEIGQFYTQLRQRLLHVLAHVEAYIDFPDEDIPSDTAQRMRAEVDSVADAIRRELTRGRAGEAIRDGVQVIILGAPNSGKSSLLNALARRDVAIVSAQAGTTRDVLEVTLNLRGYAVTLIDTAGLRESSDAIEQEGIRRALARAEQADIKILMFDGASLPDIDEKTLALHNNTSIAVLSRVDMLPPDAMEALPSTLDALQPLRMSLSTEMANPLPATFTNAAPATSGAGVELLLAHLGAMIANRLDGEQPPVITQARHRQALEIALMHLEAYAQQSAIELAGEELRHAARAIGRVTGAIDVDMILGEIFSNFCIGK